MNVLWGLGAEVTLGGVLLLWLRRTDAVGRTIIFGPRGSLGVLIVAMVFTAIALAVVLASPARSSGLFFGVALPLGILVACVLVLAFASFFSARSGYDVIAGVLLIVAVVAMSVVDWQIFRL